MCNSGSTFVPETQTILRPIHDFTSSYVDDMTTHTDDWSTHSSHIDRFLSVVKSSGLTLNILQCECCKLEAKFVGQYVGLGPHTDKCKVIRDMQRPVTQRNCV